MTAGQPLIGLIGAYGEVGQVVAALAGRAGWRLRLGGRDPKRTAAVAGRHAPDAAVATVDVTDPAQLANFCRGCQVVVNCAGPAWLVTGAVAQAATAAGAAYVDVGGDAPLASTLPASQLPVVLAAGLSPGLTGLLPRWLAEQLPQPATRLRAWCGGLERFTTAAAADMVASLGNGYGEGLAAWRGGAVVSRALAPVTELALPPFPGRVSAYPYLSLETRRLAGRLGLVEAEWYHVVAGEQTLTTLSRLRAGADLDPVRAGAQLVRAAELDLAGRRPYQLMIVELTDAAGRASTVTLRADDGYRLTAAVGWAAVEAVTAGTVPTGTHLAAEVLEPAQVIATLRASDVVGVLQITEESANAAVEEGAL